MALPAVAAVAARALPKLARGAGKFLKKGKGIPSLPGKEEKKEKSSFFSPRGFMLISIGAILDFLCLICVVLILAFGVGFLLAKIVYIVGMITFTVFALLDNKGKSPVVEFFKKQWKKLAIKAIPGIGDAVPIWTITAISMV